MNLKLIHKNLMIADKKGKHRTNSRAPDKL